MYIPYADIHVKGLGDWSQESVGRQKLGDPISTYGSTSLILIKHTALSNTSVLIFRGLGWPSATWPNQVCAAEQDVVFRVFRIYRVHIHFHYLVS